MDQPTFVVGLGRSGSSYLHGLLNRHPRIALTNEAHVIDVLSGLVDVFTTPLTERNENLGIMGVINPDYAPVVLSLFERYLDTVLKKFFAECFPDKDFTHWGDKLPSTKAVQQIHAYYPHTKFIMLVRDPRDVVCSFVGYHRKRFGDDESKAYLFAPENQARRWVEVYDELLAELSDYHLVRYERFIQQPAETMEGILDYLGLPHAEEVFEQIRMTDFLAYQRTSSPVTGSVGRYATDLDPENLAFVEDHCGPLMRRFGYLQ